MAVASDADANSPATRFMIQVTQLHVYPVKSLSGIAVSSAQLGVRGLQHDRMWMITDGAFRFVTQRELPKLATVSVAIDEDNLVLSHSEISSIGIPMNQSGDEVIARVWNDDCQAQDQGSRVCEWLTRLLGRWKGSELHLVKFRDSFVRSVDPDYLGELESHTGFADGFPFLVTSETSLEALNKDLVKRDQSAVPMNRFRPNIVLSGLEAFAENDINTLGTEHYVLGLRKPCSRCKTTTIDQTTGVIANLHEPLQTMVKTNPLEHLTGAYFGQNAILENGDGQLIRTGDVLHKSEPK